jgi:hypothetical protein
MIVWILSITSFEIPGKATPLILLASPDIHVLLGSKYLVVALIEVDTILATSVANKGL